MKKLSQSGHRQRLRDRFMSGDALARTDESFLELLLTYSIPQRDVQPLARELLRQFGSLTAILEAPPAALVQVNGVKTGSTVLIKLVDAIRHIREEDTINQLHSALTQPSPGGRGQGGGKAVQQKLFDPGPAIVQKAPRPPLKPPHRKGTGLFGKSAVKDAIALLPRMPTTDSLDEVSRFLSTDLPYNSAQTRMRFSQYFRSQMFPDERVDRALIRFAHIFPNGRDLKDVCLHRFCRSQPLVVDFVEHLVSSKGVAGAVRRDFILQYLKKRFPVSASIDDCTLAIISGFTAAGVFGRKGDEISFSPRDISLPSFAFILHHEFPEPGMYDINRLESNRILPALFWKTEQFLPSLYELRNRGLISKVSAIDSVRQFTTKWTFPQVVERLAGEAKPA